MDSEALGLYIRATEFREKAAICAQSSPDFKLRFEQQYAQWAKRHAALLEKGSALASVQGLSGAQPGSIQSFAVMQAQILKTLPADDRERRCSELLDDLKE
ncbi:hypothetical protein [Ottowia testudinis]|uniref:Uncharacterized protein n=1 Tax=Ottowia testudinis TaxID=2816950 RepID=A0A975CJM3_9BURK|nr:hypothetical protein [Ottowia testudinis]QTD46977.1 hypothetical protein J1M35_08970 [Ottowia testudinis]